MPIKPIDLQTLFTQMDRVGRERAAEKDGAVLQQSIKGAVMQQKAEEAAHAVAKAPETEDNADQKVAIRDDEASGQDRRKDARDGKRKKDGEAEEEGSDDGVIRDPRLGGNLDILG